MTTDIAAPPAPPDWHVPAGWTLTPRGMSFDGWHAIDAWAGLDADDNLRVVRAGHVEQLPPEQESELARLVLDLEAMRDFTRDNVLVGSLTEYLAIEDFDYIYAVLAAGVTPAIQDAEDPLWLMVVGAPSGGKTEALKLLDGIPPDESKTPPRRTVERVNDLTLPGLLRVGRGNAPAKGLLVRYDGSVDGLVVVTDFGAMLGDNSRSGESKTDLFNALRDIYDGRYVRENGDGRAEWNGRLTVVAACTPAIDTFTAYTSALGDRFVYYRLPPTSKEQRARMTELVRTRQHVEHLRASAANVAREFIIEARARVAAGLELPEEFGKRIGDLANLSCYGRGTVPRDPYGARDICGVPHLEDPGRLTGQLRMLALGLVALQCSDEQVMRIVRHVALSSLPVARRAVLEVVAASDTPMSTHAVARAARVDRKVARRALEDWHALGVLGKDEDVVEASDAKNWHVRPDMTDLVQGALVSSDTLRF